jgi:hypothetical protein
MIKDAGDEQRSLLNREEQKQRLAMREGVWFMILK